MKNFAIVVAALLFLSPAALAQGGKCGTSGGSSADRDHVHNIVETADAAGSFTTLLKAAKAAGLAETLMNDGPFTVFAPTDEAFAKLPAGTLESLLADKEKLKAILLYHVVPGTVKADKVVGSKSLRTAQGSMVNPKVTAGQAMLNNAKIVKTDIECSNGVIHVIDTVILPPQ